MRKLLFFGVLIGLTVSCGPRRLGCGPARCEAVKVQQPVSKPC